jgi:hypothetical protein
MKETVFLLEKMKEGRSSYARKKKGRVTQRQNDSKILSICLPVSVRVCVAIFWCIKERKNARKSRKNLSFMKGEEYCGRVRDVNGVESVECRYLLSFSEERKKEEEFT